MLGKRRAAEASDILEKTTDAAHHTASVSTGTVLTALVSLFALLMSGVSLYQTVLKQANLNLFVPDTISYTRDPNGSFEVIIIPVTIANSGARDGVISSIDLSLRNTETQHERKFHATFFAGQGYFSTKEDYSAGISRPKTAFAPITVAGRSGYSGTLLFYPRDYSEDRVVPAGGKYEIKLSAKMQTVEKFDFLDRVLGTGIEPIKFTATLPQVSRYFSGQMLSGKFVRMFVEEEAKPEKQK